MGKENNFKNIKYIFIIMFLFLFAFSSFLYFSTSFMAVNEKDDIKVENATTSVGAVNEKDDIKVENATTSVGAVNEKANYNVASSVTYVNTFIELKNAIAAGSFNIVILNDFDITGSANTFGFTINNAGTIDFNGHELEMDDDIYINLSTTGSVSFTGSGTLISNSHTIKIASSYSTLYLSGDIKYEGITFTMQSAGHLVIDNGFFSGDYRSKSMFLTSVYQYDLVTINRAAFSVYAQLEKNSSTNGAYSIVTCKETSGQMKRFHSASDLQSYVSNTGFYEVDESGNPIMYFVNFQSITNTYLTKVQSTIRVVKNISACGSNVLFGKNNSKYVLDLNGAQVNLSTHSIIAYNNVNLEIMDSHSGGTGKIISSAYFGTVQAGYEGSTLPSDATSLAATLTIKSGTIENTNTASSYAAAAFSCGSGSYNTVNTKIIVQGGTLISTRQGVYNYYASFTLNSGSVTANDWHALYQRNGVSYINGGTIQCTNGNALMAFESLAELYITGGTITGNAEALIASDSCKKVGITGGTFVSAASAGIAISANTQLSIENATVTSYSPALKDYADYSKSITIANSTFRSTNENCASLVGSGNVTIKGTTSFTSDTAVAFSKSGTGTLTIENGTFTGKTKGLNVAANSGLVGILAGTFSGETDSGLYYSASSGLNIGSDSVAYTANFSGKHGIYIANGSSGNVVFKDLLTSTITGTEPTNYPGGIAIFSTSANVTIGGANVNISGPKNGIYIHSTATVTLNDNVTVSGVGTGFYNNGGGTIVINDGATVYGGTNEGIYDKGAGSVIMNGGTLSSNKIGIFAVNTGTVTINDGTIDAAVTGIYNKTGVVTIYGGSVTGTSNEAIYMKDAGDTGKIYIYGGRFYSNRYIVYYIAGKVYLLSSSDYYLSYTNGKPLIRTNAPNSLYASNEGNYYSKSNQITIQYYGTASNNLVLVDGLYDARVGSRFVLSEPINGYVLATNNANTQRVLYSTESAVYHTVSFLSNYGENDVLYERQVAHGNMMIDIDLTATRPGCAFVGWAISPTANEDEILTADSYDTVITEDTTLYAVWDANTYTVNYNINNGSSGVMGQQSFVYDESKALTTNAFARTNYNFLGWSTSPTATTPDYTDGQIVSNLSEVDGAVVELYAVWQGVPIAITFVAEYSTTSDHTQSLSLRYSDTLQDSIVIPYKEFYTFSGYYTEEYGQGEMYYNSNGFLVEGKQSYQPVEDMTFYAKWVRQVGIDKQTDETLSPDAQNLINNNLDSIYIFAVYNTSMPTVDDNGISLVVPTKPGWTFAGYYSGIGGTGEQYYDENLHSVKNMTYIAENTLWLYAKWTKTITINRNDGAETNPESNIVFNSFDCDAELPVSRGYSIKEINSASDGTGIKYINASGVLQRIVDTNYPSELFVIWNILDPEIVSMTGNTEVTTQTETATFTLVSYHAAATDFVWKLKKDIISPWIIITPQTIDSDEDFYNWLITNTNNTEGGTEATSVLSIPVAAASNPQGMQGWMFRCEVVDSVNEKLTTSTSSLLQVSQALKLEDSSLFNDVMLNTSYEKELSANSHEDISGARMRWIAEMVDGSGNVIPVPEGISIDLENCISIDNTNKKISINFTATQKGTYRIKITGSHYFDNAQTALCCSDSQIYTFVCAGFSAVAFVDANGNEILDLNERKIENVSIVLYNNSTGAIIEGGSTNANGGISFVNDINYEVKITLISSANERILKYKLGLGGEALEYNSLTGIITTLNTLESSTVLYVILEQKSVVSFNLLGKSDSPTPESLVDFRGMPLSLPTDINCTNIDESGNPYRFVGWSTVKNSTLIADRYTSTTFPSSDIVLYAVYILDVNTITFLDGFGAVVETKNVNYLQTNIYDGIENPSHYGYNFTNWKLGDLIIDESTTFGDLVNGAETSIVSLTATWELKNDITVTFNSNGTEENPATMGKNGPTSLVYDNQTYNAPINYTAPRRLGYNFIGWSTDANYQAGISDISLAPNMSILTPGDDVVYYAIWESADIYVTFDANGGSFEGEETGEREGNPESVFDIPAIPVREGYTFVGWFTRPGSLDGTQVYAVTDVTGVIPITDTVIYAHWAVKTITITLIATGCTPETQILTGDYGTSVEYIVPTKLNQEFAGFTIGEVNKKFFSFPSVDSTYYAVMQPTQITIAFVPMGGAFEGEENGIRNGSENEEFVPPVITRNGYDFDGWFSTIEQTVGESVLLADGEGKYYIPETSITYYARWSLQDVFGELNANGGSIDGEPTKNVMGKYSQQIEYSMPTKVNATFLGWSTTIDNSSDDLTFAPTFYDYSAPIIYYAIWQDTPVQVTFDSNGGSFVGEETGLRTGVTGSIFDVPTAPTKYGYTFDGWYNEITYENLITFVDSNDDSMLDYTFGASLTKTYYAKWTPVNVEVTLNANGGQFADELTTTSSISGAHNSAMILDEQYLEPTKEGFVFKGWSTTVDNSSDDLTTNPMFVVGVSNVYAIWEEIPVGEVAYTFNTMGGEFVNPETGIKTGAIGSIGLAPVNPSRANYTFVGWFTSANEGTQLVDNDLETEGLQFNFGDVSAVYYAHWQIIEVDIYLDANGGLINLEVGEQKDNIAAGSLITYSIPAKDGYTFVGWSTTIDNSSVDLTVNPICFVPDDASNAYTLYAIYTPNTVTINFNANGGAFAESAQNIITGTVGNQFSIVASPIKVGYTFAGWYSVNYATDSLDPSIEGAEAEALRLAASLNLLNGDVGDLVDIPLENITYYAYYTTNDIVATLNANNGEFNIEGEISSSMTETGKYGALINYTQPIRSGYHFVGWRLEGETDTHAKSSINYPSEDVTYYAVWKKHDISVVFELMGGTATGVVGTSQTLSGVSGIEFNIPQNVAKTGFDFVGWFISPTPDDLASFVFDDSDLTGVFSTQVQTTYYAIYTPTQITILLDANGGNFGSNEEGFIVQKSYTNDQNSTINYQIPIREQYAFAGWSTTIDNNSNDATFFPTYPAENGTTLYAIWTDAGEVSVIFNANGGEFAIGESGTRFGAIGSSFVTPVAPTKVGYTFDGWFKDTSFEVEATETEITTISATPTIMYAKWTLKSITITFNIDGNEDTTTVGDFGTQVSYLEPTKAGYTFKGWKEEAAEDSTAIMNLTYPSEDITLYAVFEIIAVTVTFDNNNGETNIILNGDYGTYYTVPENPTLIGFVFNGWYENSDFTGEAVVFEDVDLETDGIQVSFSQANKAYFAKFAINNITITLDVDGTTSTINGDYGTVATYVEPTKTGYTFKGWKAEAAEDSSATKVLVYPSADITLYAVFEVVAVTVTFDNNNDTPNTIFNGNYGTHYTVPTNPTKEGYIFVGWYENSDFTGEAVVFEDVDLETDEIQTSFLEENKTYYALFNRNSVTITLNVDERETETIGFEGEIIGYVEPTKTGYTFKGWKEEAAEDSTATKNLTYPSGDITLYAVFEANDYNVALVLNDGAFAEGNEDVTTYTYGEAVTLPMLTKEGYTFAGWFNNQSLTGEAVTSILATDIGDKTFFAKFTIKNITITLDVDGTTSTINGDYGTVATYEEPTKAGYTFKGWKEEAAEDSSATKVLVYPSENITLYAVFEVNDYNVTLVLNDGAFAEGNEDVTTYTYGEAVTLPTLTKEGYTFAGWFNNQSLTGEAVTSILATDIGDKTFFAKFTIKNITITLDVDGTTSTINGDYGTVATYEEPTKTGYTFKGWKAEAAEDSSATKVLVYPSENITLYAVFEANDVEVTFVNNNGTLDTKLIGENGDTYTIPNVSKTGYIFNGWYENSDFTGEAVVFEDTDVVAEGTQVGFTAENKTYYAKWTANEFTVTYNLAGGQWSSNVNAIRPETFAYGIGLTSLPIPIKSHYNFLGWATTETEIDNETYLTFISSTTANNVQLYARWIDRTINLNSGVTYSGVDQSSNLSFETRDLESVRYYVQRVENESLPASGYLENAPDIDDELWEDSISEIKDAGKYNIYYKVFDDGDFSFAGQFGIEVDRLNVQITEEDIEQLIEKLYNGEEIEFDKLDFGIKDLITKPALTEEGDILDEDGNDIADIMVALKEEFGIADIEKIETENYVDAGYPTIIIKIGASANFFVNGLDIAEIEFTSYIKLQLNNVKYSEGSKLADVALPTSERGSWTWNNYGVVTPNNYAFDDLSNIKEYLVSQSQWDINDEFTAEDLTEAYNNGIVFTVFTAQFTPITGENYSVPATFTMITVADIITIKEEISSLKIVDSNGNLIDRTNYVYNESVVSYLANIASGNYISNLLNDATFNNTVSSMKIFANDGVTEITSDKYETTMLATGMIIKYYNNDMVVDALVLVIKGDTNGDGFISLVDMARNNAHIKETNLLEGAYKLAGNVNTDSYITLLDIARINAHIKQVSSLNTDCFDPINQEANNQGTAFEGIDSEQLFSTQNEQDSSFMGVIENTSNEQSISFNDDVSESVIHTQNSNSYSGVAENVNDEQNDVYSTEVATIMGNEHDKDQSLYAGSLAMKQKWLPTCNVCFPNVVNMNNKIDRRNIWRIV